MSGAGERVALEMTILAVSMVCESVAKEIASGKVHTVEDVRALHTFFSDIAATLGRYEGVLDRGGLCGYAVPHIRNAQGESIHCTRKPGHPGEHCNLRRD